jgi:hypothetical protein
VRRYAFPRGFSGGAHTPHVFPRAFREVLGGDVRGHAQGERVIPSVGSVNPVYQTSSRVHRFR